MVSINIVTSEQHPDCCSANTTLSLYKKKKKKKRKISSSLPLSVWCFSQGQ